MRPGTLFFDRHFKFHDGEDGQKILVTLGTGQGVTIVAKTTSRGARYLNDYGCQPRHRFPCFHLVKGCCSLKKPTWICFGEFYEFTDRELLQRHFSGDVNRIGELPEGITVEVMECALSVEDISGHQRSIVRAAVRNFTTTPEVS